MTELRVEHYKSLKDEHRQYMMQIQQLWLFKWSTLGGIIALAIFNDKLPAISKDTIVACGLISLPLLSMLIDLKVLEFSLYIKAISIHLIEKYSDIEEINEWESHLWSGDVYSKTRTWITIIAALGTSYCILLISFVFLFSLKPEWKWPLIILSFALVCIPLIIAIRIIPKLLK